MNIVDRLAVESRWVREFADRAHVVKVPFSIFAADLQWRQTRIPAELIPRFPDGRLRTTDARAPFPKVVIMSELEELGALFVEEGDPSGMSFDAGLGEVIRALRARLIASLPPGRNHSHFVCDTFIMVGRAPGSTEEGMSVASTPTFSEDLIRANREVNPELTTEEWRRQLSTATDSLEESLNSTQIHVLFSVAVTFTLLNTKNIVQERTEPRIDRAIRRRIERGERAPYIFHTLKYRPFGKRTVSDGTGSGEGSLVALHMVRGHFRTYTEAAPLFGKYTGRWWWQPHVRGTDSEHVVDKDYSIEI
jgi:hypothetical protein